VATSFDRSADQNLLSTPAHLPIDCFRKGQPAHTCPYPHCLVLLEVSSWGGVTSEVWRRVRVWYPRCRLCRHLGYHTRTVRHTSEVSAEGKVAGDFYLQNLISEVAAGVGMGMCKPAYRRSISAPVIHPLFWPLQRFGQLFLLVAWIRKSHSYHGIADCYH
jgi:hypothetical protein